MVDATVDGHRAGWQMALHAIGDAALDLAIEAFEKAQAAQPRADARHRIEHGGAIRDDQLVRLAQLGVIVVSQPSFVYDFGDRYADQLGPERTAWLYRGRSPARPRHPAGRQHRPSAPRRPAPRHPDPRRPHELLGPGDLPEERISVGRRR